jgi:iron complex outermembrane receptor protein
VGHADFWQVAYGSAAAGLGPEEQSGTELGLDLTFRRSLRLQVTRFDQRASGLIQQVAMPVDSNAQTRRMMYLLENVGEITNRGWEMEASANISRLTLSGTFTAVDSRVRQLAFGYHGDLETGDRMLLVPARTASLNASWVASRWHFTVGGSRAMDWINYDELSLAQAFLNQEHSMRDLYGAQLRQYWRRYSGGARVRASMSRDIANRFSFELSGDNLLNYQRDEPDNITILPGRTLMTGLTIRF